jgi:hypothetical protein
MFAFRAFVLGCSLVVASAYVYNSCQREEIRKNLQFMSCCAKQNDIPTGHHVHCNYTMFFEYLANQRAMQAQHSQQGLMQAQQIYPQSQTMQFQQVGYAAVPVQTYVAVPWHPPCLLDDENDPTPYQWGPMPQWNNENEKNLAMNTAIFQCMATKKDNSQCCKDAAIRVPSNCRKLCKPVESSWAYSPSGDYTREHLMTKALLRSCAPYFDTILQCHYDAA